MTKPDPASLEAMAAALEASGQYRVLRRLRPSASRPDAGDAPTRLGLFVDVETTGLDPARDEIIELAMVPFTYGLDGVVHAIGKPFQAFQQSSEPIPPEITAITGITDAMVAGRSIDPEAVTAAAAPAALVIAHNAAFDRRFVERFWPVFSTKPWACSMSQVDWAKEGHEGVKLSYLAAGCGFFYDRHRATEDCLAAIEILSLPLVSSGRPAMAHLLETARQPTWRIWAQGAPYDFKDILKARGYRWNGEDAAVARCWSIDVADDEQAAEFAFLKSEIYQAEVDILTRRITAYDRFSARC
jgi:DNA polymerase-3 subunit epsilon